MSLGVLRPRHYEIIRQAFLGRKNFEIAAALGLTETTISVVLNSPLAKEEMARLQSVALEKVADTPLRLQLQNQLQGATREAVLLRRGLMNNETVSVRVRADIAKHFMDREIYEASDEGNIGSYREIIRKLDQVQRQLTESPTTIVVNPVERGNGSNGHDQAPAAEGCASQLVPTNGDLAIDPIGEAKTLNLGPAGEAVGPGDEVSTSQLDTAASVDEEVDSTVAEELKSLED